jgi:hypothetical protein
MQGTKMSESNQDAGQFSTCVGCHNPHWRPRIPDGAKVPFDVGFECMGNIKGTFKRYWKIGAWNDYGNRVGGTSSNESIFTPCNLSFLTLDQQSTRFVDNLSQRYYTAELGCD